ncbi:hypothetical protein [Ectothiorhodospira shaposhnikovii]|uniref:hypothetical protein n=1 Tax=Ectothiorhodospira shaposhnikovii TaxID=1054 RepID=UPI0039A13BC8
MTKLEKIKAAADEGVGYGPLDPVTTLLASHNPESMAEALKYHRHPAVMAFVRSFDEHCRQVMSDRLEALERQTGDSVLACVMLSEDAQVVPYLRRELREKLHEGLRQFLPDLKPLGVDHRGTPCYRIEDVARALGASEAALIQQAREAGIDCHAGEPDIQRIQ